MPQPEVLSHMEGARRRWIKDVPLYLVVASMVGDGKVGVDCIGRVLVDGPRARMLAYTVMPCQ